MRYFFYSVILLCLTTCIPLYFMNSNVCADTKKASLIRTIDTSKFSPPSPDPTGIVYLESSKTFLICDSEVNEIPHLFTGDNLFEINLSGNLIMTLSTMSYSNEPAGSAINPLNKHLFFCDDSKDRIFEVNPGADGLYGTSDDKVTSFPTRPFNSYDPEGLAFDSHQGVLFLADGTNAEIYRISPGANGIFDGVPPTGDDQVTHFDTESLGIYTPEGLAYNNENGFLYIAGKSNKVLLEVTTTGVLRQTFDISALKAASDTSVKLAGLDFGPSSQNPDEWSIYITDRGVDNNRDPNENDGKVYEMFLPLTTSGNQRPTVNAGTDQTIQLPDNAILKGTVSDDGLPNPPGTATTTWSKASGPGTVTFADAKSLETTASFSEAGTYVLRLTADDSELTASDEVTIVVLGTPGGASLDIRVTASSDDAEEKAKGGVSLTSSNLELVFDGSIQTVGIRFPGVSIPKGSTITNAYLQFTAGKKNTSEETSLKIQGENAGNATTFTTTRWDISSRPRTTAAVSWSPNPWLIVNEAGTDQRTPNIAAVIQEIVNHDLWASSNSLVIIITGTGQRRAFSFDGRQQMAPLLHVQYNP